MILLPFRRFNDLDQVVPLAYYLSKIKKYKIKLLCLDPSLEINKIKLIRFLNLKKNISCLSVFDLDLNFFYKFVLWFLYNKKLNYIFRLINKIDIRQKIYKKYVNSNLLNQFILINNIKVTLLDYPYNSNNFFLNLLLDQLKKKNIKIIGYHHGVWIRLMKLNGKTDLRSKSEIFKQRNIHKEYDKIIIGNNYFKKEMEKVTHKKNKFLSLGNLRFSAKWHRKLMKIYGINKNKPHNKSLRVLYLDHHYKHGLDGEKIYDTIKEILNLKNIDLIIKPNTSTEFKNTYSLSNEKLMNFQKNFSNKNTIDLINWSDVVINTVSSVGIEAILQKKTLIIPKYLQTNLTMFEKYKVCYSVKNKLELKKLLNNKVKILNEKFPKQKNINIFFSKVLYGGCTSEEMMYKRYFKFFQNLKL